MKTYAGSEKSWNGQAVLLRSQYSKNRQAWLAAATPTRRRIPVSNDAAVLGLSRRRGIMFHAVGVSEGIDNQDVEPAAKRLSHAWEAAVAADGGNKAACARILPAAREAYSVAKGAVSANANRVDMIMQDYATDAAYWIAEIRSPGLAEAARDQVAGDADGESALLFGDAAVRVEAVVSALYCADADKATTADAEPTAAPKKGSENCKLPSAPLNLGPISISVGCDGVEFGVEAGLAANVKLDRKTRSGTIFFGAGAKVPTGWDKPVTTLGAGAAKAGGLVGAEGKAGMIFKFDGSGVTDAGFEFGMKGGSGTSAVNYQVDITIVGGLQLSSDMTRPLDALADKMWGPAPGTTTRIPPAGVTKPK